MRGKKAVAVIAQAKLILRESAYNCMKLGAQPERGEAYSRAVTIYWLAMDLLRLVDPENADSFRASTYQF